MLIYQINDGGSNSGKKPGGGVVAPTTAASSMNDAIANPITFYCGSNLAINQSGHSGDLHNYYWASYSRGTDGIGNPANNTKWHNLYLDSYIPLRHKSIYDPCPYGYRIPSNGTYNHFTNTGWTLGSYAGGTVWNTVWISATGRRSTLLGIFDETGYGVGLQTSITYSSAFCYQCYFRFSKITSINYGLDRTRGVPVRCIEECEMKN